MLRNIGTPYYLCKPLLPQAGRLSPKLIYAAGSWFWVLLTADVHVPWLEPPRGIGLQLPQTSTASREGAHVMGWCGGRVGKEGDQVLPRAFRPRAQADRRFAIPRQIKIAENS